MQKIETIFYIKQELITFIYKWEKKTNQNKMHNAQHSFKYIISFYIIPITKVNHVHNNHLCLQESKKKEWKINNVPHHP